MTKFLLSAQWVTRLEGFKTLWVGLSGGLDSLVLLHVLTSNPSLRDKIHAVHINHGLSSNALLWQQHCEAYCQNLGIAFHDQNVHFERSANIEEGARKARYAVFSSLVTEHDCLVVGHHENDQAETLLLNLLRGSGIDGLAAMLEFDTFGLGRIARPLLSSSRQELEAYALAHQLSWVEDESNQDIHYSRNFLRHQIMPLLAAKWPGVVGTMARTAKHCQQALVNLSDLAVMDSQELVKPKTVLGIKPLASLSLERLVNVIRFWLKGNQIPLPSTLIFQRLIHEVLWASPDARPLVSWGNIQIRRYQDHLYILRERNFPPSCMEWPDFPLALNIGEHLVLTANKSAMGFVLPKGAGLKIQYRKGGELFIWHGQTKQLKKLFQEWGIPPWERDTIPLVYVGDQLAVVVGYAVSDLFYGEDSAWQILPPNTQAN